MPANSAQLRLLGRAALAAVGTGAACLTWGVGFERHWYALRHVTVPVLRPTATRPLRLLHISDLHLLPGQDRAMRFVQACADTGPDLIVATGDLLGDPRMVDPAIDLLTRVALGRPALAVLGSNDRHGPVPKNPADYLLRPDKRLAGVRLDTPRLVSGLTDGGWEILSNRRICLDTVAGQIDVTGMDDPHIGRHRPQQLDWAPPRGPVALRLGLVHSPYTEALTAFDRAGFDLALSGHTHGGQVRVPGIGALTNNCDLPLKQSRGLSRFGADMWLHVSAGLGHSRYAPVRFACRPEATLIDLIGAIEPPSGSPYTAWAAENRSAGNGM